MNLSDKQYTIAVFCVAFAAMGIVTQVRYCGDFDLPKKPAKPEVVVTNAKEVSDRVSLSSEAYRGFLETDAKTFGTPPTSERQMSMVFPYRSNDERHSLAPGDSVEVLGLKLTLGVERTKGSSSKQMMLTIENLGHQPLAYRVQSRPSSGKGACAKTRQVQHNALAIAASGTVKRAECVYRSGRTLEITGVETIALPELAFHYLSSMDARNFAMDAGVAGAHMPPSDAMKCRVPQAATLRNAIDSGKIAWRDQAEFYARHRCLTYSFSPSFKAFQQDGEVTLPAGGGDL